MAEVQTAPVRQFADKREETKREETKGVEEKTAKGGEPPKQYEYGVNATYTKKLGGLLPARLITLNSTQTVRDALTVLSVRGLTAAPVWDEERNEYRNYIDMLDLLSFLISLTGKEIPKTGTSLNFTDADIEGLENKTDEFLNTKIGNIAGLAGRNQVILMRKDETLADAIENYLKGCHRVLVTDKEGHVIGVVSQSTIAKYLEENIHRIKYDRLFNGTVWDFPFKSTSVSVVKQDTKVLDALAHMRARNLMAVGVTDETGRLVGNLSASDLQSWHLFGPKFHRLGWSVARFLKNLRRTQAREADFVVCVQRDITVLQLLTVFGKYSVHRVYIIDENGMPSGVVSLTDIMKGLSGDLRKGQYQGPEVFTTGTTTTTTGISKEQGVAGGSGAAEKQPAFESS